VDEFRAFLVGIGATILAPPAEQRLAGIQLEMSLVPLWRRRDGAAPRSGQYSYVGLR
jgi:hypothetical protein